MSRWGIDHQRIATALSRVRESAGAEWADDGRCGDGRCGDCRPDDEPCSADGCGVEHFCADHQAGPRCAGNSAEPGVLDELFARAIWSVLVEPGDATAGALIGAVGAVAAARLVIDRASPVDVSDATRGDVDPAAAKRGLQRWTERLRADDVLRSLDSAGRSGAQMVVPGDRYWPAGLDALGDSAPVLVWARGAIELMRRPGVAIVGARAATGYGEHVAMEFAAGLSARDVVVVSGGAYGIDGMAHRATLASGGATIAVLAGGIDRFYPSGHEALLTRVAEQGLLLSEVPCGTPPTKWRFLQRNRLIAALAAATVVVEAGRRSGSLNTASHALTMGRPVGIVPGPITSAASAGCHATLRSEPVTCVTTVTEVMQLAFDGDGVLDIELADDLVDSAGAISDSPTNPFHLRVIDALRPRRGQSIAELARAVGDGADQIRSALGVLDLEGLAAVGVDGLWRRVPPPKNPPRSAPVP